MVFLAFFYKNMLKSSSFYPPDEQYNQILADMFIKK